MFLNRIMSKVMSKSVEDTDAGTAGKSFPHCVALMILSRDRKKFNLD